MRRVIAALCSLVVASSLFFATSVVGAEPNRGPTVPTLDQCQNLVKSKVLSQGHLTLATDRPVYRPWFIKDDPTNQLGYESALAYAIANSLGFSNHSVRWVLEPYATSYSPGTKPFDFDINEVVATPSRIANVSFSHSYYDLQQSLVAMKSDPIVHVHGPAALVKYHYGALANSPAASYVTLHIKPTYPVLLFINISDAIAALESNRIDAIVIDTPTGNLLVNFQIQDAGGTALASQVGQFAPVGDEYYGMVLQKRSPLLACVNVALTSIRRSGLLHTIAVKWLGDFRNVPLLKP